LRYNTFAKPEALLAHIHNSRGIWKVQTNQKISITASFTNHQTMLKGVEKVLSALVGL
jgi:hypothetical protein